MNSPDSAQTVAGIVPDKRRVAETTNSAHLRHGWLLAHIHGPIMKDLPPEHVPDLGHFSNDILARSKAVEAGDLALASSLMTAQALTLDAIFTELARRMAINMLGENPLAMETYGRLALKAQAQSRATLEALAKLHQPKEQTVRHVHVNEGGQAVIADEFHHHQHGNIGGSENAGTDGQPYATGTRKAGRGPALPGPDPFGSAVPLTSREGQPEVPHARRQRKRRA